MILPGLPEDQILTQLIYDKKVVAREAKKMALKYILRFKREGLIGVNKDYDFEINIKTTKYNNTWKIVVVVNMARPPFWMHFAACEVESEYGSKDFYLIRGFSNKTPYFIKISSHVLKRFRERGIESKLNIELEHRGDIFAPMIIRKGEVITWMKISESKFWKIISESEDKSALTSLYYTCYGCYLGNETENGNIIFKTFLSNEGELKKLGETETMEACKYAHFGLNRAFYNAEMIKELEKKGLDDITKYWKNKLLP